MKSLILASIALFCGLCDTTAQQGPYTKGVSPLVRLEEPVLAPQPKGSSTKIYRLMIAPTWGNRFCFRIQSTTTGASLTIKRLTGQAGYGDGPLADTKQVVLTADEFATFEAIVSKSGYEKMGERDPDMGLDGDSWSLESSKEGFHHTAIRWCPNDYDPKKRGTEIFVQAFRWAADRAGVTKQITNKGHAIFDR